MRKTGRFCSLFPVLVLLSLGAVYAAPGEDDCSAQVYATLEEEEGSSLQFSVEVSTTASCAEIEYDLIIEERLPNGQSKRIRKIRQVKLNGGSLTELVEHTLAEGHAMLSHEARVESCRKCGGAP